MSEHARESGNRAVQTGVYASDSECIADLQKGLLEAQADARHAWERVEKYVQKIEELREAARSCGHGPENWEKDCALCELVAS